jgi:hypothetical protein
MRRRLYLLVALCFASSFFAFGKDTEKPATVAVAAVPHATDSERISVDFPNEEIVTILRNVADMYELNLVVPEDLKGKRTSLKLRNVTWRQIFRETLTPAGYTFIEDGNIVRVVSQDALDESQPAQSDSASEPEEEQSYELPAWLYWLPVPFALIHLVLAVGVLRDRLPGSARFAPKFVWALAVLLGGIVPLLIYWTIHHSTLARSANHGQPPVLS